MLMEGEYKRCIKALEISGTIWVKSALEVFTMAPIKRIIYCLLAILYFLHHLENGITASTECRKLSSVEGSIINSATNAVDLEENSDKLGHVWQHISGITTRPTKAKDYQKQKNKTLFESARDFKSAFQLLKSLSGTFAQCLSSPKSKSTRTRVDKVRASDLGIRYARQCGTKVDSVTGICTDYKRIDMTGKDIIFVYRYTKFGWILLTAYPNGNDAPEVQSYFQWFLSLFIKMFGSMG